MRPFFQGPGSQIAANSFGGRCAGPTIPYHDVQRIPLHLPPRPASKGYIRAPREMQTYVPDHAAEVEEETTGR